MNQQYRNFVDRAAAILIVIAFVAASATAFVGYAAGSLTAILIGLAPSVALTVWGFIFFFRMLREKASEETGFDYLITHGEKIRVSLDRLVIKSNAWQQETAKGPATRSHNEYAEPCQNFITLDITHRGKSLHWETLLAMEPDLLRIRLLVQGHTNLYYDPKTGGMYLDLEFLGRHV